MATKEEILGHIRFLAKRDGASPSIKKFRTESGVPDNHWLGKFWTRWNDVLVEAGLAENTWSNPALEREHVLRKFVSLVSEIGKIPTQPEMQMKRLRDQDFPSVRSLRKAIGSGAKRNLEALEFARLAEDADAVAILQDAVTEKGISKVAADVERPNTTGFVYLIKSGKFHKIGKTNSPDRRQYEIGLHLAEGVEPIHSIETDDPSGIEAYWHNRFKNKRMNGEWFNLDSNDIRAFRLRKKFM